MDLYGKHECPPGSLVGHAKYGRGVVLWEALDLRMVQFEDTVQKTLDEMSDIEVFENSQWGDEVIGVSWVETMTKLVPVAKLKFFADEK
jgi:hypothetical protein